MTYLSNMSNIEQALKKFFSKNDEFEVNRIRTDNHVHEWGTWEIIRFEFIDGDSEWENGAYYFQNRRCEKCGFRQFNLQKLLI